MPGLEKAIHDACSAKISSFERYRKRVFDENRRRQRRSGGAPQLLTAKRPSLWDLDPGLDPFHVRSRASSISHAIEARMRQDSYAPMRPAGFRIRKPDGDWRLVTSFPIADEVVSSRLYRSLLRKNRARLSARSYAYRDDLGVYDALTHMHSEWRDEQRLFVAQYDFSDFFGSISHNHIRAAIRSLELTMTALESRLLAAFLSAPQPYTSAAEKAKPGVPRERGVHQGTSISLLLANIAAAPLDRTLERLGVSFVRYADDLIIWSRDYSALCRGVEELHLLSERSGCEINQKKSEGVRLLVSEETKRAEMAYTSSVDYLSHSVGLRTVRIKEEVAGRIRERINSYLYNHLLREPLNGTQDMSRVASGVDRDYVAFIWQLRKYLYGSLSEEQVRRLLRAPIPPVSLSGAVARFPLINDRQQLAELDEWIAAQAWLALRRRAQILGPIWPATPEPWGRTRAKLIRFRWTSGTTGLPVD
ncbi:MAG: RNA-directed polymerase, partial [Frankiales bacterium]|nr:RNA-directed polymerase [Frankiales bacterium]